MLMDLAGAGAIVRTATRWCLKSAEDAASDCKNPRAAVVHTPLEQRVCFRPEADIVSGAVADAHAECFGGARALIALARAQYSITPPGPQGRDDSTARIRRMRSLSFMAAMIFVVGA